MRRSCQFAMVAAALLPWGVGCKSATSNLTFSSRVVAGAEPERVFAAGRDVLLASFGRLEEVDARGRTARTVPEAYQTRTESGSARDIRRGRSQMRRIASLRVNERDTETIVRVRVEIERQDVARTLQQRQQMQQNQVRISDYPGDETALDRDAATDAEQNTVWTFVRRDQEMEQELLRRISAGFAAVNADATAPQKRTPVTVEDDSME